MRTEFRNRVFLPLVIPMAILVVMLLFIGAFALTLLHGTHDMSLMLAAVAAGGILFTISLAASQDRLETGPRAVLAIAVATPFIVGALFAAGVIGDIAPEEQMINVEPPVEVPEDAILAAENSDEFCEYDPEADDCVEPTELWTVGYQGPDEFRYRFVNLEQGVPHNLSIRELEGDRDDPQPGEELHQGEVFPGPGDEVEVMAPGLEPGDYFFVCDVHAATMIGVLEVVEDGGAEDGAETDDA